MKKSISLQIVPFLYQLYHDGYNSNLHCTRMYINDTSLSTKLNSDFLRMSRFNNLMRTMWESLEELRRAIKGLAGMSEELDNMFHSLLNNEVCVMCVY